MASEQRFTAAVIQRYSADDGYLFWFSTSPKKGRQQVCYLVSSHVGDLKKRLATFETELNGQHNFRVGGDVDRVDVSPTHLRVGYMRGMEVERGIIDGPGQGHVRAVHVTFTLSAQDYMWLLQLLAPVAAFGISVKCAPWRKPPGKATKVRWVPPK